VIGSFEAAARMPVRARARETAVAARAIGDRVRMAVSASLRKPLSVEGLS
jgi:hypothetical protein